MKAAKTGRKGASAFSNGPVHLNGQRLEKSIKQSGNEGKTGMLGSDRRSVSADEQETTINFFPPSISSVVNVYSCIPSEIRYYLRMAEEYPEDVKIVRDDGYGIDVELPSS